METDFDVVVIGAGVGGCCAAIALARQGARVVLLEAGQPGRHKVCGEFLSPEVIPTFQRLGVWGAVQDAGADPVSSVHIRGGARFRHNARQDVSFGITHEGWALGRDQLDTVLWQAATREGCDTRDHARVHDVRASGHGHLIQTNAGELHARFVLGATGKHARFRRHASLESVAPPGENATVSERSITAEKRFVGLKAHLRGADVPRGQVHLYPVDGGYCGVVALSNGLVNVCSLVPYALTKGNTPARTWQALLDQNSTLSAACANAEAVFPWLATGNLTFGHFRPVDEGEDGVMRLGDAAGYIHPFSGDGMSMAARSGELAAATVGASLRGQLAADQVPPLYAAAWHREFDRRLLWASRLHYLLVRPFLYGPALSLMSRLPGSLFYATTMTRGRI